MREVRGIVLQAALCPVKPMAIVNLAQGLDLDRRIKKRGIYIVQYLLNGVLLVLVAPALITTLCSRLLRL